MLDPWKDFLDIFPVDYVLIIDLVARYLFNVYRSFCTKRLRHFHCMLWMVAICVGDEKEEGTFVGYVREGD
jgi:hypothetical protein